MNNTTEKTQLSVVELQEQLQFFQQRCLVLRAEIEKRDEQITKLKDDLAGNKKPAKIAQ